jgi:hypothetical protein
MKKMMILFFTMLLMGLLSFPVFSKESQKILYKSDGLIITKTKATYKGKVIYDAVAEPKKYGDDAAYLVYHYTPLSLIGPYFSYRCDFFDGGAGGCQYSKNFITVTTINLITNQSVSVLELVDEDSLVTALKKDKWVRRNVESLRKLDSCRKFEEIIEMIGVNGKEQIFYETIASNSFYFVQFDRKTTQLALRLARNEPLGCSSQNILFELGLWVKPKKGMEHLFLQKSHFYLGKFKN